MASKALVAMTPPSEYMNILIKLSARLPSPRERCCHNRLHGQLLQIKAVLERALCTVRLGCHPSTNKPSASYAADLKWACQIWDNFSAATPDLKLSLVTWVVDERGWQEASLGEAIQRVLQSNLREALLSHSVEYRRAYLAALVAAMARGDSALPRHHLQSAPLEEPVLPECLDLLLRDMEDQRGGPEYLSQALSAASLLLSQCPDSRFDMFYCLVTLLWNTLTCSSDFLLIFVQISMKMSLFRRLCNVLECQRSPDAPEALRMACAGALCVAPLINLREHSAAIMSRLISTGLCLLQDQSQQVRMKAACFASMLHHVRRGESQRSIYLMQVNQALLLLLDTLLEECWDTPGTLEVLLFNLPQSDLRSVLREASETAWLTDTPNPGSGTEPEYMDGAECCTGGGEPCSLQKTPARYDISLSVYANDLCYVVIAYSLLSLSLAETLTPDWLALLMDPCVHSTLCGLLARAAFLLRLLKTSDDLRCFCDPSSLHTSLQDVYSLLVQNGVHFASTLTAAVAGELPA
ncbi:hypothetical protein GBF38_004452 [Nibea albiflora]|uniref:Uncharacterized protein n=1 Tax=Nibea albiflora TaxID=240163 RepID=A0ACB7FG41_NIBAL|nr:hypothetical protein GBF38_004452 [Nibea albiflora]